MTGSQVSSSPCLMPFRGKQDKPPSFKERWEGLARSKDPKDLNQFPANRANTNMGRTFTVEAARGIPELTPTARLCSRFFLKAEAPFHRETSILEDNAVWLPALTLFAHSLPQLLGVLMADSWQMSPSSGIAKGSHLAPCHAGAACNQWKMPWYKGLRPFDSIRNLLKDHSSKSPQRRAEMSLATASHSTWPSPNPAAPCPPLQ